MGCLIRTPFLFATTLALLACSDSPPAADVRTQAPEGLPKQDLRAGQRWRFDEITGEFEGELVIVETAGSEAGSTWTVSVKGNYAGWDHIILRLTADALRTSALLLLREHQQAPVPAPTAGFHDRARAPVVFACGDKAVGDCLAEADFLRKVS